MYAPQGNRQYMEFKDRIFKFLQLGDINNRISYIKVLRGVLWKD